MNIDFSRALRGLEQLVAIPDQKGVAA